VSLIARRQEVVKPKKKKKAAQKDIADSFRPMIMEITKESDRGAVLVAACVLDETLKMVLKLETMLNGAAAGVVEEMFRTGGPLSTFAYRLKIALTFGLIRQDVYTHINALRSLRNDAAHIGVPFSFSDRATLDTVWSLPGFKDAVLRSSEEHEGERIKQFVRLGFAQAIGELLAAVVRQCCEHWKKMGLEEAEELLQAVSLDDADKRLNALTVLSQRIGEKRAIAKEQDVGD
jgi:DNA-binding MltR family transcriptional regulator